jgi:hypothetical protein
MTIPSRGSVKASASKKSKPMPVANSRCHP